MNELVDLLCRTWHRDLCRNTAHHYMAHRQQAAVLALAVQTTINRSVAVAATQQAMEQTEKDRANQGKRIATLTREVADLREDIKQRDELMAELIRQNEMYAVGRKHLAAAMEGLK